MRQSVHDIAPAAPRRARGPVGGCYCAHLATALTVLAALLAPGCGPSDALLRLRAASVGAQNAYLAAVDDQEGRVASADATWQAAFAAEAGAAAGVEAASGEADIAAASAEVERLRARLNHYAETMARFTRAGCPREMYRTHDLYITTASAERMHRSFREMLAVSDHYRAPLRPSDPQTGYCLAMLLTVRVQAQVDALRNGPALTRLEAARAVMEAAAAETARLAAAAAAAREARVAALTQALLAHWNAYTACTQRELDEDEVGVCGPPPATSIPPLAASAPAASPATQDAGPREAAEAVRDTPPAADPPAPATGDAGAADTIDVAAGIRDSGALLYFFDTDHQATYTWSTGAGGERTMFIRAPGETEDGKLRLFARAAGGPRRGSTIVGFDCGGGGCSLSVYPRTDQRLVVRFENLPHSSYGGDGVFLLLEWNTEAQAVHAIRRATWSADVAAADTTPVWARFAE